MKIFKFILSAAISCGSFAATAQTVDEVLAKNYAAMGGVDKLNGINSVKMTGNMSIQGTDIPVVVTNVHGKGMRMDLEIMGQSNYIIATPTKGYAFIPAQGMSDPQEMSPDQVAGYSNSMNLHGTLNGYKDRGIAVEYAGTGKEDGTDVVMLKAATKEGKHSTYYFDAGNNRLIKVKSVVKGPDGSEIEQTNTYTDYKQTADGFWYPMAGTNANGSISWDKVEVNIPVDEKIFQN